MKFQKLCDRYSSYLQPCLGNTRFRSPSYSSRELTSKWGAGCRSWYSDQDTGWTSGKTCLDSRRTQKIYVFSKALGSKQPPIQTVPGAPCPGLKCHGREADNSPPSSAEIRNTCSHAFTSPYAAIVCKRRTLLSLFTGIFRLG